MYPLNHLPGWRSSDSVHGPFVHRLSDNVQRFTTARSSLSGERRAVRRPSLRLLSWPAAVSGRRPRNVNPVCYLMLHLLSAPRGLWGPVQALPLLFAFDGGYVCRHVKRHGAIRTCVPGQLLLCRVNQALELVVVDHVG